MSLTRRTLLTGLAATATSPALAQFSGGIRPQSDPYAQVNPYDDPRNGFSDTDGAERSVIPAGRPAAGNGIFQGGVAPPLPTDYPLTGLQRELSEKFLAKSLKKYGGIHQNRRLQQALEEFCAPFLKVAARQDLRWEVFLPAADITNASAFPGGKLFFFGGIIHLCDDPSEFGAIVAHEIGHVDYDHHARGIQTNTMIQTALSNQNDPRMAEILETALGNTMEAALNYGWSRQDEFEADAHSLVLLAKLGMDPMRAENPFKRLLRTEPPDHRTSLFSTHPGTVERIAKLQLAAPAYPRAATPYSPPGWDILKAAFPTPQDLKNI